jgi:phosphohistidine swiveling domain-containing protein
MASEGPLPDEILEAVRNVAVRAFRALGTDRLEWGVTAGEIMILQLSASGGGSAARPLASADGRHHGGASVALARVLATRRGPLADRLLAPWAAILSAAGAADAIARAADATPLHARALALLDRAERLDEAVAAAWGRPIAELRDVLATGAGVALEPGSVAGLRDAGTSLLADVEAMAADLSARGVLPTPEAFWRSDATWLLATTAALDAGEDAPPPPLDGHAFDPWDDLRFGVARAKGDVRVGIAASPGRATGRPRRVTGPEDAVTLEPGDVLVVEHPVPALAPLLWDRGGVIAASGSPGSHLCEVARSIHVPMIVGVDVPARTGEVVAIDGATGETWSWRPSITPPTVEGRSVVRPPVPP